MIKSSKANIYKFSTATALGILMVWFYVQSRWSEELTQVEKYCILCDAFSLPGLLFVLSAMLMSVSNRGGLDTLAYLMSYLPRAIAPGAFGEPPTLLDFVEERRAKRKKGYGFLYIVGFIFLGIAFAFLALFYSVS